MSSCSWSGEYSLSAMFSAASSGVSCVRRRRPTTFILNARASRAHACPMSPNPMTPSVRPRSSSTSYGSQRASALARARRGKSLANQEHAVSVYSASEWLYTPLALVSVTGPSTSAGNSRCSSPALELCIHCRPVSLGHSAARSSLLAARAPTPQLSSTSTLAQSASVSLAKSCRDLPIPTTFTVGGSCFSTLSSGESEADTTNRLHPIFLLLLPDA
mmetsp:Transcript_26847/g.68379  ORF Transcript_26847/g.68379 Transcript_26847/m.68379 type:complete len:217 (-) Transcript_26847:99-749(-)